MSLTETVEDKQKRLMSDDVALAEFRDNQYQDVSPEEKNMAAITELIASNSGPDANDAQKSMAAFAAKKYGVSDAEVSAIIDLPDKSQERYQEKPDVLLPGKFELIRSTELTNEPKDYQWLLKGLMEKCNLAEIFGPPESGKSLTAIEIAFCVACGIDWYGHEVSQGSVVYIAGEGFGGLGRRVKALEKKYNCKAPDLFLSKAPTELINDTSAKQVSEAIAEICGDSVLVVIDTLNRNFGAGDENSTKDMTTFIGNIDYYLKNNDASVIIVHHSGLNDKGRSRGNSSLFGALDLQYHVTKTGTNVTFKNTKSKDIPPPKPIGFVIKGAPIGWTDEDGNELTAPVLELSECVTATKSMRMTHRDEMAIRSLRQATATHGIDPTSAMKSAFAGLDNRKVIDVDHWRNKFYSLADIEGDQDTKRKAFQRTRQKLLEHKKIVTMDGYFWEIFSDK